MKPIEPGCLAVVIGCNNIKFQHLVGKSCKVIEKISSIHDWISAKRQGLKNR